MTPISALDLQQKGNEVSRHSAKTDEGATKRPVKKCFFQHFTSSWMDSGGDAYDLMNQQVTGVDDCEQLCCEHAECQSFTFWRGRTCFLRASSNTPRPNGDSFSGCGIRLTLKFAGVIVIQESTAMDTGCGQEAVALTMMESARNISTREDILRRIEALAAEFLEILSTGKVLELEALKRDSSAMIYDHENQRQLHGNDTRLIKLNRQGGRKYTGIWLILQTAHALLTENKTATQRDVYYLHPFFKGQGEADEAILDAGSILGIPRDSMNIVAATKGCFTGDISVLVSLCFAMASHRHDTHFDIFCLFDFFGKRDGKWRHFGSGEEVSITHELLQLKPQEMKSNATCILVIEKDGIFNRLREDKFFEIVPSILITGRGFPDLATRVFVSLLRNALEIPVLGLCDCNPFGLSIMLTYKLGSARMPLESLQYAVDIKWVGVRPSQIADLDLPISSFKALTRKDLAVADSLFRSSFIQANDHFKDEVQMWLGDALPWKIELEALHVLGFTFLTSFLQACIEKGNYL
ncbi:hypothetical protein F442_14518 [Phytophthora nicotianae P10297]|uniref:DNA topoisomerase (ATP-hydrolyzing) n=3 Tax=Phytophthora nicotianae TaxID=4792 RepID=W2PU68_PHYN3|nr:hypothetical protein PPTG_23618 [Phytophthora nicotianae INRA-310]ETN04477.1 hypothetical protein PPTG_23618 [Phytophthora nicotianae INRA-310]ETP37672.1 hypothetical protein F442_14518 [Phytophthora nicotianae P10297]